MLDPEGLQENGGFTATIALLAGSPAIDAIPAADCTDQNGNAITTDQRGVARPQGNGCDIGAFEVQVTSALARVPMLPPFLSILRYLTRDLKSHLFGNAGSDVLEGGNSGDVPLEKEENNFLYGGPGVRA